MLRKIWKNRVEFYPYVTIYMSMLGTFANSLIVKNRPGIIALGLITLPSAAIIARAAMKTYQMIK